FGPVNPWAHHQAFRTHEHVALRQRIGVVIENLWGIADFGLGTDDPAEFGEGDAKTGFRGTTGSRRRREGRVDKRGEKKSLGASTVRGGNNKDQSGNDT